MSATALAESIRSIPRDEPVALTPQPALRAVTASADPRAPQPLDTVTLRPIGRLDLPAARSLQRSLEALSGTVEQAVVDFSAVTEFLDVAVVVLAEQPAAVRLRLRGLRRHHEKLFACFGVRVDRRPFSA